jgi:hypothetical protein
MKAALAVLALLPFAAQAELVVLEYGGVVTRLVNEPRTSLAPGNVLGGFLFVDTVRAGADSNPSHRIGFWGSDKKDRLASFITGYVADGRTDFVSIKNRGAGEIDEFRISDSQAGGEGIELSVSLRDFLDGDRLDQAFAFRRPAVNEPGESMLGRLRTAPGRFVEFLVTQIRFAPPGRCSAP